MKNLLSIISRALVIAVIGTFIGVGLNFVSTSAVPWIYVPPEQVELSGVMVTIIDHDKAFEFFSDPETVFVDTREKEDFQAGHVKGALNISSYEKEEQYPMVAALMPDNYRIILYCHGPECDMAEKVAAFLGQLGYKNMMIMSSGYPLWAQAGYPVEKGRGAVAK